MKITPKLYIIFLFHIFQTEILYTYSAEDIDGPSFNTFKFYSDFAENDLFFIKENGDLCNNTALTEKNDSYTFNIWVSFLNKTCFLKHCIVYITYVFPFFKKRLLIMVVRYPRI